VSTLCTMDDPEAADQTSSTPAVHGSTARLPGEPLESGFNLRSTAEAPEATLSPDAQARVLEKIDSVDEARLRAAKDGHTAYIG
jgi:hypothetical protein